MHRKPADDGGNDGDRPRRLKVAIGDAEGPWTVPTGDEVRKTGR